MPSPSPVSRSETRAFERRWLHSVVWFVLLCFVGLILRLNVVFFPSFLNWATFAGALLAGGAAAFAMRQDVRPEQATFRRRLRFAKGLLAASLPLLILLFAFLVKPFDYGKRLQRAWVPIGFSKNPVCCAELDNLKCIEKLTLSDAAIRWCWGDASVTSVRLGLVLSYWGTALACGLWIGLLQIRKPYPAAANRNAPIQAPVVGAPQPSTAATPMYDLFLSYSSEDRPFVEGLVRDLENQGLVVWWDQPWVRAGDSIISMIEEGLLASRRFAVVLSPTSRRSRWVTEETHAALAVEKERQALGPFVIPILYQDCDVPVFLKDRRHADFRSSYEHGLRELLRHFTDGP